MSQPPHTDGAGSIANAISTVLGVAAYLLGAVGWVTSLVTFMAAQSMLDEVATAKQTIPLRSLTEQAAAGRLVSVTGPLQASRPVGADPYLKPAFVFVRMAVKRWESWDETSEFTDSAGNTHSVTTPRSGWVEKPAETVLTWADAVTVDGVAVDLRQVDTADRFYLAPELPLTPDMLQSGAQSLQLSDVNCLEKKNAVRYCFHGLPLGQLVTIFGKFDGQRVGPAQIEGQPFYLMRYAERAPAIEQLGRARAVGRVGLFLLSCALSWLSLGLILWGRGLRAFTKGRYEIYQPFGTKYLSLIALGATLCSTLPVAVIMMFSRSALWVGLAPVGLLAFLLLYPRWRAQRYA